MLEARGLHKVYATDRGPVPALVDLNLQVAPGEFVAVCGRSGSGKSTLLGMLGGLCRPTRGSVYLNGVEVWSLQADALARFRNRQVGFVFQFASLLPTLRVCDNIALPALLSASTDLASAHALAEALLQQVGLQDRRDAYPGELSGGEQRRAALARALINRPPLLLADEPTSDLDEDSETEILELLLELHRTHRTTLVVVTHSAEIAQRADRVVYLRHGCLEESSIGRQRKAASAVGYPALGPPNSIPHTPSLSPAPTLGAGLGRFLYGFAAWTALVVAGILAINQGASFLQHRTLAEKKSILQRLEETALQQLRADIENLAHGPDRTCLLTLYVQNLDPDRDLFVLAPSVQVHVQVGRGWEEVPSRSRDRQEGRVVRLTGRHRFEFVFQPDVKGFEEQIAGYMHVRVSSAMLISLRGEPGDDLFDRADAYYVYLKPHGADDADILRKNGWSGKPPLWIPMPPH